MTTNTKRGYARSYVQAPILFANTKTSDFLSARMCNASVDGMHIESEHFVEPGTDIRIKVLNSAPDPVYNPEAYKVFRARVKWCRKIEADSGTGSSYWIGVKYHDRILH